MQDFWEVRHRAGPRTGSLLRCVIFDGLFWESLGNAGKEKGLSG